MEPKGRLLKCERLLDERSLLLSRAEEFFGAVKAAHGQMDQVEAQVINFLTVPTVKK